MTTLNSVYGLIVLVYSTHIMVFDKPQRLDFTEWVRYPLRRYFVQNYITFLGYVIMPFPGLSAVIMPFLGVWAISDFLDYKGYNQLGDTLSIPFDIYYY